MDVPHLFKGGVAEFEARVQAIGDDDWERPTPNPEWNVRDLVNHIVGEDLWAVPIFDGKTVEDVGDRFDGDVLGDDPKDAWRSASAGALGSVDEEGAMERTVHLSFGDFRGSDYTMQLFADHLIHAWDLARGLGADERLDPALVDACAGWFEAVEEAYRAGGAIAERPDIPEDADAQTRLLAMFGRRA